MASIEHPEAWIETSGGARVPIVNSCTLGRARQSGVALEGDQVSRRHALIHPQGEGEYSLVDLGSANGTRLNGRRVIHPKALKDGDEIEIGGIRLRFRISQGATAQMTGGATRREVKTERCWLMLADLVGGAQMMNRDADPNLPLILGAWFAKCGQTIEANGGAINKYLGDGWLAFWPDEAGSDGRVAATLAALSMMQGKEAHDFRLVAHCGPVLVGGMPSNFEDPLLGPELNFIFRVEKVAGALGARRCLTEAAAQRLAGRLSVEGLGTHAVKDFSDGHALFTFAPTSI